MNFDIQSPGFDFLVLVPAVITVAAGLALHRRIGRWPAAIVAALLPAVVLVVLTIADEGVAHPADLAHVPIGWGIWTMLSLPGTLLGLAVLLILHRLRHRGSKGKRP